MDFEETVAHITAAWGNKTLAEFRDEAGREDNGTVYESIRVPGGHRLMLIICLTDVDQIGLVERAFEFVDDGATEDWNTMTLGEVLKRTVLGAGISFEALRDAHARRAAMII